MTKLTQTLIDFWDRKDTAGFYELQEIVNKAIKDSLALHDQSLRQKIINMPEESVVRDVDTGLAVDVLVSQNKLLALLEKEEK